MDANTVEICTTALLRYLLINVKTIELEKVSLLLTMFVNTLTSDDKYSILNCANLNGSSSDAVMKEEKDFSDLFSPCLKSRLNFEHLGNNMSTIAYVLTKIQTPKHVVRQMSKKSCFRRPYDMQHGKRSQTLLKSARQHNYFRIFW